MIEEFPIIEEFPMPEEDLQSQMDEELGQASHEQITGASYTHPETGESTSAETHIEAAAAQGVEAPEKPQDRHGKEYGYEVQDPQTGNTRYVSRDEAEQIGRTNGQVEGVLEFGKLHSHEVKFTNRKGN